MEPGHVEKKKLFLIEDEAFLRDILEARLDREGYEVHVFDKSANVATQAQEVGPDLILLDIIMAGKNGFDVMNELLQDPLTSKIPVMILSNVSQASDKEKAAEMGAVAYLIKANHSPDDIIQKVKEVLASSSGPASGPAPTY